MRKRKIALTLFMIVFFILTVKPLFSGAEQQKKRPFIALGVPKPKATLAGLVLVLDPGHGGKDPGAHGVFQGAEVVEDEYVYDVAKRVELFAVEKGAVVYKTIYDSQANFYRNWPAQQVFADERTERFSLDNSLVVAKTKGLNRRLAFVHRVLEKKYPGRIAVFVSIHFDVLGNDKRGVHIITPSDYEPSLAYSLLDSFKELNSDVPLKRSGQGVKNIYVLGKHNPLYNRVLIELGNFENEADNWQIRNYQTRNRYAFRIIKGLENFAERQEKWEREETQRQAREKKKREEEKEKQRHRRQRVH